MHALFHFFSSLKLLTFKMPTGLDETSLNVVYYCTGHGLGHATRSLEVCKHLIAAGHHVTMVTGTTSRVFTREIQSERFKVRDAVLDTGSQQKDAFTVDQVESLRRYEATAGGDKREELLEREVMWLIAKSTHVVVSDIVPLAFVAASKAAIPSVAVSNFSWDFIYSEYLTTAGSHFRQLVWQIADDYSYATKLLRLPGYVPMPAFREIIDVPLVVRPVRRTREEIRAEFQVGGPTSGWTKLVVFIYGGQPPGADWKLEESCLPPDWMCVVCAGGQQLVNGSVNALLPSRFTLAPPDAYTPDLIAAADCVLGKIGYGTTSECLAHATPLIFLRRDHFNEEPFLRKLLEVHDAAVEMKRRDFLSGNWAPYLQRALRLRPKYAGPTDGAATVAEIIQSTATVPPLLQLTTLQVQGKERLRDTIAWGYALGRPGDSVDVPEWYARGGLPTDDPTASSKSLQSQKHRVLNSVLTPQPDGTVTLKLAGFDVVQGPELLESEFPDTLRFVSVLDELAKAQHEVTSFASHELRAAAGLFDWTKHLMVTRAPGRLDVMGGIADYSGSTVLQMPLAESAHVAIQLQFPDSQRLWQHQAARGGDGVPALRVVSMNADATNRGHAFDVDLTELTSQKICTTSEGGERSIVSYEAAKAFFKKDPALSWAAYVVGALVVLMHEKGLVCHNGIAMLVSSDVPEGKGVSSSAAIEVASMQALAAAHDIHLDGRELALLCQKVENFIVGAPCGVMDQMASALGEADWLMALCCQPAEVERPVHIPQHIRFWGIDSGIRHSVGGSDYGAVRTGAFMGLKILTMNALPSNIVSKQQAIGNGYLANVPVSRYSQRLKNYLPQTILGSDFIDKYGQHWDDVTHIDPQKLYAVEVPTSHPIHENFRVLTFRQTLAARGTCRRSQLEVLGELMLQSHASYSNCGLGSQGTDRLVDLVMEEKDRAVEMGMEPALFGAKITGGGCGGTVCVIGKADDEGEAAIQRVVQRYAEETGHVAQVFAGSSGGVVKFGVLRLSRQTI